MGDGEEGGQCPELPSLWTQNLYLNPSGVSARGLAGLTSAPCAAVSQSSTVRPAVPLAHRLLDAGGNRFKLLPDTALSSPASTTSRTWATPSPSNTTLK